MSISNKLTTTFLSTRTHTLESHCRGTLTNY